ncbi:BTB/POZ domain-containing protein [Ditylenchus destructor]|nr:BTB/POZ domain-containing protein [Ditylenchus destructor]
MADIDQIEEEVIELDAVVSITSPYENDTEDRYSPYGSLNLRIDRFTDFVNRDTEAHKLISEPVYFRGLPLQLVALTRVNQNNTKELKFFIQCDGKSAFPTWNFEAKVVFYIMAQNIRARNLINGSCKGEITKCFDHKFCNQDSEIGYSQPYDILLDQDNGFISDNTLILNAEVQNIPENERTVSFHIPHTCCAKPRINFGSMERFISHKSPYPWDFVLIVDDEEYHVQKSFLSMYSEYFKDQFAKHHTISKAVLPNIESDEFFHLLCVIYPISNQITADNVETITELAYKLKMTDLLKECEAILVAHLYTEDFEPFSSKIRTLLLAQWYDLGNLMAKCIAEIKSGEDITALREEPEYSALTYKTKRMLLDNVVRGVLPLPNDLSTNMDTSNQQDRATMLLQKLCSSTSCNPDAVLLVENNRIPVHKMFLSVCSEYFDAMFKNENNFKEKDENEIVLEEVRYNDIMEVLVVIYPIGYPVNEKNIGSVLEMADRFIMPAILERCKKELKTSTKINGALKLLYAQRYRFSDLYIEYVQQYKSISDAAELKANPEYELIDDKTRALIFDNISFSEIFANLM